MQKNILVFAAVSVLIACLCKAMENTTATAERGEKMTIKVTSSAFDDQGLIPAKYTCQGQNISPPLQFQMEIGGIKSIALICDDPDAPIGTFVHWVLFNLPSDTKTLAENIPVADSLKNGARQGKNDFGKIGYGGPCPPSGTHRYFFKVYALDKLIDTSVVTNKKQLLEAMQGHIIGQGQLMGKYKKN
jgi:Raf kinase inhibitor-like YbhB/YbcL family protein